MRHVALLATLLAIGPSLAAAQSRQALPIPASRAFTHGETILMGWHEPSGYSNVELRPMRIADSTGLWMLAMFVFPGRTMQRTPTMVSVAFISRAPRARFAEAKRLTLTVDGKPVPMGELFVQPQVEGDVVKETLALRVPTRTFLQLVNAHAASGRVGSVEFTLTETHLEALRDFASRLDPRAHAQAIAATNAAKKVESFEFRKDGYEMTDVDEPARPSLIGIPARYPDLPDSLRVSRTVLVEYVVDTTGKVDLATVRGRAPEQDAAFLEELRRVMPEWEFYPAVKNGTRVRQVIRQAFVFEPPAR